MSRPGVGAVTTHHRCPHPGESPSPRTASNEWPASWPPGRAAYARRKAIVEPVFGQMSTLQNAKHLLLRGLDQTRGEWLLLAACHNLRKLHSAVGVHGLAALTAI
ncbi:transposase [Rhodococcus sp. NM-2]|uniref:transposase n=1 Tax=Rhodococcus sp. NM-2 TaxID=3401174 RepID=UPI003AACD22B